MRFHQGVIDTIIDSIMRERKDESDERNKQAVMDDIEIILRNFRESAIRTGRMAGMADARARKSGSGPRKRR